MLSSTKRSTIKTYEHPETWDRELGPTFVVEIENYEGLLTIDELEALVHRGAVRELLAYERDSDQ